MYGDFNMPTMKKSWLEDEGLMKISPFVWKGHGYKNELYFKNENRAIMIFCPNTPIMTLDDFFGNRKSQTGAAGFFGP